MRPYSLNIHPKSPLDISRGNLSMATVPYSYNLQYFKKDY